jgi:hypothetical protein
VQVAPKPFSWEPVWKLGPTISQARGAFSFRPQGGQAVRGRLDSTSRCRNPLCSFGETHRHLGPACILRGLFFGGSCGLSSRSWSGRIKGPTSGAATRRSPVSIQQRGALLFHSQQTKRQGGKPSDFGIGWISAIGTHARGAGGKSGRWSDAQRSGRFILQPIWVAGNECRTDPKSQAGGPQSPGQTGPPALCCADTCGALTQQLQEDAPESTARQSAAQAYSSSRSR